MYVVEVIPVGRGIPADSLSYFSHVAHPRGTLVSVPLRSKHIPGIVIDTAEVSTMKTALKAATFALRRLPEQSGTDHVSTEFLNAADKTATYFAAPLGSTVFALLPKEIRSGSLSISSYIQKPRPILPREASYEVFQDTEDGRYREYTSLIRESFASQSSVLFVAPTLEHARYAEEILARGIKEHVVLLHSMRGTPALKDAYKRIGEHAHPLLIIATPQYAFIERSDVGVMVIEHVRSAGYHQHARPHIDYRHALKAHGKLHLRRVIVGDTLIPTEDEYRLRNQDAMPYREQPKRLELSGKMRVVEMKRDPDGTQAFSLLSKELLTHIDTTIKNGERCFLYTARRGLAPIVACVDCGHIMRAPDSGAPLSLYRREKDGVEERWFISSVSGYRERAKDTCPSCGGWRLKERGIGIQQVHDDIKARYPDTPVILFDHTTANTPKRAQDLREKFYKEKGVIMLGTALTLPYLTKPVALSAMVSIDSLKAIPSWRQQEEALGILLTLREKTDGTVIIQTRSDDDGLLGFAEKGSTQLFYDHELSLREAFHYPPYAVFIHLSWRGKEAAVEKLAETIRTTFAQYNISVYGVPGTDDEHGVLRYGLIRLPESEWPHEELIQKLRELSPAVRIMINPDRIV